MEGSEIDTGKALWAVGNSIQKLRSDVNTLAWLLAEEKWLNRTRINYYTERLEPWHGKAGPHPSVQGPTTNG